MFKARLYTTLCAVFTVLLVTSNLVNQKFITLNPFGYHFDISVGAMLYPLTFFISDLIAEFYDKGHASFCIKLALSSSCGIGLIIWLMDKLPATAWSKVDDTMFHTVFSSYGPVFIASLIACYIAQRIDISLYLKIKTLTGQKWLWLRNNVSTALSLLIDTTLVISLLVLMQVLPHEQWLNLIINSYLFKLFFTLVNTPLFYLVVGFIRKSLDRPRIALTVA